jgi:hypothetical protein
MWKFTDSSVVNWVRVLNEKFRDSYSRKTYLMTYMQLNGWTSMNELTSYSTFIIAPVSHRLKPVNWSSKLLDVHGLIGSHASPCLHQAEHRWTSTPRTSSIYSLLSPCALFSNKPSPTYPKHLCVNSYYRGLETYIRRNINLCLSRYKRNINLIN